MDRSDAVNDSPELPADVMASVRANRKIEAIKLLREQRGLGLKEAKQLVEAHMEPRRATRRTPSGRSDSNLKRLAIGVLVFVVAYVLLRLLFL